MTPRGRLVAARPWPIGLVAVTMPILVSCGVAAAFSWSYWGYVLAPPGVHKWVLGATALHSHGVFRFNQSQSHNALFSSASPINLDFFATVRAGDGAFRLVRPSVDAQSWSRDWTARGLPASGFAREFAWKRLPDLYNLIVQTAQLSSGSYGTGFPDDRAQVEVFELSGPKSERLLFIALTTGELSNDHLAYYELLYDDNADPPRLIDRKHWRFDVAGLEGLEFATLAISLSIVLLPATLGVLAYALLSKGAMIRRGRCPTCRFDLLYQFDRGCSECGWGKGEPSDTARDLRQYSLIGRVRNALSRPPRWTLLALALGAALTWFGRSMPGGSPRTTALAWVVLQIGAILVLLKVAGISFPSPWRRRPRVSRTALGFAIAVSFIVIDAIGMSTQLPLKGRFALSRKELERVTRGAIGRGFSGPLARWQSVQARAGLYWVSTVSRAGEGYIVWVGGAGGQPVTRAFVWYPKGRPAVPAAQGARIKLYDELGPGWFLWNDAPPESLWSR